MTSLDFDVMPSMGKATMRAFLARKKKVKVDALPQLSAKVSGVCFDPSLLESFHRLCSVPDATYIPPTALHVMVAPLHMMMLANPAFPMPLLGLVHIDNRIVQHRAIEPDAVFDITSELGALGSNEKGARFEIVTRAMSKGEIVWEEVSGILKRTTSGKKRGTKRPKPRFGEQAEPARSSLWDIPADAGRRYAALSGDYNPIHLTAASAKLFGFKRAIVHGMWSLARCVSEMDSELKRLNEGAYALDVSFKTPVFLPSQVAFHTYDDDKGGVRFALRSSDGVKPHLVGHLSPLT